VVMVQCVIALNVFTKIGVTQDNTESVYKTDSHVADVERNSQNKRRKNETVRGAFELKKRIIKYE